MKTERAYKELDGMKIFVVYKDGQVGEYKSEASAIAEVNQNDGAANSVVKVIIGRELKMLTEECEQLKCFVPVSMSKRLKGFVHRD